MKVNFGRFFTDLKIAQKVAIFWATFKSCPIGEKSPNLVTLGCFQSS
jgi:hypothetical protein